MPPVAAARGSHHPPGDHVPIHIDVLSAACAALGTTVVVNPLELAKTRVQLHLAPHVPRHMLPPGAPAPRAPTNVAAAMLGIMRYEGLRGIQQGFVPYSAFMLTITSVRMGLYRPAQRALTDALAAWGGPNVARGDVLSPSVELGINTVASGCTGLVAGFLGTPFVLVKTRAHTASNHRHVRLLPELWAAMRAPTPAQSELSSSSSSSSSAAAAAAVSGSNVQPRRHVKHLFGGAPACMLRVLSGNVSQLVAYDWARGMLDRGISWCQDQAWRHGDCRHAVGGSGAQGDGSNNLGGGGAGGVSSAVRFGASVPRGGAWVQFGASVVAGVVKTTVASPVDVVLARLYAHGAQQFRGPGHCLVHTVKTEGVKVLFRGWVGLYLRLAPGAMLVTMLWERLRTGLS